MNEDELTLGKEYWAYGFDESGNKLENATNIYINISRSEDITIELFLKKTDNGLFKVCKMKEINQANRYLKRIKNRQRLYNKLKRLGR